MAAGRLAAARVRRPVLAAGAEVGAAVAVAGPGLLPWLVPFPEPVLVVEQPRPEALPRIPRTLPQTARRTAEGVPLPPRGRLPPLVSGLRCLDM